MKDTLCIDGGHSHHQYGVILVGFHAIFFTVQSSTHYTSIYNVVLVVNGHFRQ